MANHSLVVPFLDAREPYALGVEFGMLYQRMQEETHIEDYFSRKNQEQILLTANRLAWNVIDMQVHDECWFWLEMEKR